MTRSDGTPEDGASHAPQSIHGTLTPGQMIAQYRIGRKLGSGGMGAVYLADDTRLERQVAIKVLSDERHAASDTPRLALREARAAAALDHPNICTVYEVGAAEGIAFIAMQYIDGEPLSARLKRGPLSPSETVRLGIELAGALGEAHAHGIVHRDVKPQNVIVTPGGLPKLLDFGIARQTSGPTVDVDRVSTTATAGGIVGTPGYMAPEQVLRKPVDGRTDLFALGALLYECFTGRPAFSGASLAELFADILHREPPPPSSVIPALTPGHDNVCRRLLAKEPDERFDSAADASTALRAIATDTYPELSGPSSERSARLTTSPVLARVRRPVAVIAGLLAIVGAIALFWNRAPGFDVPPSARQWYEQGSMALREGSYTKARRALTEAVRIHDRFPLAHARLAEALSELDEPEPAKTALLKATTLAPDPAGLGAEDALSFQAIRSMVLRDFGAAAVAYTDLARRLPERSDVQVDLGRAYERFERADEARAAYVRATEIDPRSGPAFLRLGVLLGQRTDADQGDVRRAFARAEQAYETASNYEGVVETLLAQGAWLNEHDRLADARTDLTRALRLAIDTRNEHQRVRALLQLSTLAASEGRFEEAQRTAEEAVERARQADMDGLAAWSLVDLGNVLFSRGRLADADRLFEQAAAIANRRGAPRTEARALLSRGSALLNAGRPKEAAELVERALLFYQQGGYTRMQMLSQTILAGAYGALGDFERARVAYEALRAAAAKTGDEAQRAAATEGLSIVLSDLGRLPEALAAREESLALHQKLGASLSIPFDLMNKANLLARLGRFSEADETLALLEAAVTRSDEAYVTQTASISLVRARVALYRNDAQGAAGAAALALQTAGHDDPLTRIAAQAVRSLALARLGRRKESVDQAQEALERAAAQEDASLELDVTFLAIEALIAAQGGPLAAGTLERARRMPSLATNSESSWRLEALAVIDASNAGLQARPVRESASLHLAALARQWQRKDYDQYLARPDLVLLRRLARLNMA